MRVLLWDIDGTLIRSVRTGAYKDYTIPVLEEIFGTAGRLAQMEVSGMTDLQIVCEALSSEGFTTDDVMAQAQLLAARLTEEAEKITNNGARFFELLPGVPETLQALADHPRYESALLTGNIESMAQLKMKLVGLDKFFTLPGAFGDESHNSRDLTALAAARIRKQLGIDLAPEHFIIIGDTPNDIDCAPEPVSSPCRANGVATGDESPLRPRPADLGDEPDAVPETGGGGLLHPGECYRAARRWRSADRPGARHRRHAAHSAKSHRDGDPRRLHLRRRATDDGLPIARVAFVRR
jgi:phosphoglycolate phosphatase-like HAD superfamily hydrolase